MGEEVKKKNGKAFLVAVGNMYIFTHILHGYSMMNIHSIKANDGVLPYVECRLLILNTDVRFNEMVILLY